MKHILNEDEWKPKLKVVVIGYGEKREKRINLLLENTIWRKANQKAVREHLSLNECINQLLFIWAKDEVLVEAEKKKSLKEPGDQLPLLKDLDAKGEI